jgi:hypothetical protein
MFCKNQEEVKLSIFLFEKNSFDEHIIVEINPLFYIDERFDTRSRWSFLIFHVRVPKMPSLVSETSRFLLGCHYRNLTLLNPGLYV